MGVSFTFSFSYLSFPELGSLYSTCLTFAYTQIASVSSFYFSSFSSIFVWKILLFFIFIFFTSLLKTEEDLFSTPQKNIIYTLFFSMFFKTQKEKNINSSFSPHPSCLVLIHKTSLLHTSKLHFDFIVCCAKKNARDRTFFISPFYWVFFLLFCLFLNTLFFFKQLYISWERR